MSILGSPDPFRVLAALRSASARLRSFVAADHATIHQRSMRSYGAVMSHAFLHAAVAPSRRIRPGSADHLAEHAAALAASLGLPPVPYLADGQTVRFADIDNDGSNKRSLLVTRSGVLEMLWALDQLPTEDGSWALRALDACTQLACFARLVSGADYGCILASSRCRRTLHARVDWRLGVSTMTADSTGLRGWRDILVVGPQPDRASGHAYGAMSPLGYGTDELRGAKRSRDPQAILTVMLEAWLRANGYLRIGNAVDATIAASVAAASVLAR